MAVVLLTTALLGYTAPGLLAGLVAQKLREVERLRLQPEAREDGSWSLRLGYPASSASYTLARSLGWKREKMAILADLKRTAPGRKLGEIVTVSETLNVPVAIDSAIEQGLAAALVAIDKTCYGGSAEDLLDARHRADAAAGSSGERLPVIAKDVRDNDTTRRASDADKPFSNADTPVSNADTPVANTETPSLFCVFYQIIVDPLQIARAAALGADAVLIIVAACAPDFPSLLNVCTLMGIEALVEVHTPDEVSPRGMTLPMRSRA